MGWSFTALICKRNSAILAALLFKLFMLQIYKVFHSKSEIIFSQNKIDNQSIIIDDFSDVSKYNSLNKFLFTCISPDPIKAIKNWFPNHDFIQAAGGLVTKDQQYLWIYRNGTWDLPKGKLEKDENFKIAAIRETRRARRG